MRTAKSAVVILAPILLVATLTVGAWGGAIEDAITRAGDRLVGQQAGGSWAGETGYIGSIAAGLVNAYEVMGTGSYKTAAESAGTWILTNSAPYYYGDEAYALTRLSAIAADPGSNPWRTAATDCYQAVKDLPGGTAGYISDFSAPPPEGPEPSTAVFYLSEHAVAADYVNATDKALWRNGVIDFLATVEDSTADYPVMALGIATWALAQTGPMDDTLINPAALTSSYWYEKKLVDLPGALLGHQVVSGDNAGSFYYRFDHAAPGSDPSSGYTEDTIFGTLGLLGANDANPALGYEDEILDARLVLADGVAGDGKVQEHIWSGGVDYHTFAGETLQALPEPATLSVLAAGSLLLTLLRRRRTA